MSIKMNGKAKTSSTTFRSARTMPQWVLDQSNHMGPKPPPPPPQTSAENGRPALPPKNTKNEPDYEVIEFGGQYSNTMPTFPAKPGDLQKSPMTKCELCGSTTPTIKCDQCDQHLFCASCDDMYHRHPKRQTHMRKTVTIGDQTVKPPLPPKGEHLMPIPPPRRRGKNSFRLASPLPGRKDQVQNKNLPPPRPQPPPSPTLSLREKMNSLKRMVIPANRPLPDTPQSSRPQTPKSGTSTGSVFDSIKKQPSVEMGKIQSHQSATLDRMSILQQRYRQHQEAMKAEGDRSRRPSTSSNWEFATPVDPNTDFWGMPGKTTSLMTGINTAPSMESPNMGHPFNYPPQNPNMQRRNPALSASVFDLNQQSMRNPKYPNPQCWSHPQMMQETQSVAQLNCMNCHQICPQQQWGDPNLHGSNMSLNLPPQGYYPPPPHDGRQQWMNPWGPSPVYPYPISMVPVMATTPRPSRSRAQSRTHSRAASPALSIKSRKSTMSSRLPRREFYMGQAYADDEDSDIEDFEDDHFRRGHGRKESIGHRDRRPRKNSTQSSIDFDDDTADSGPGRGSHHGIRDRRGQSLTKAESNDWIPSKRVSDAIRERELIQKKKNQYTDSFTESEQEPLGKMIPRNESKLPERLPQKFSPEKSPEKLPPKVEQKEQKQEEEEEDIEDIINSLNAMHQAKAASQPPEPNPEPENIEATEETEEGPVGPPPSAPDFEWECEYCTYVNEPNTKICGICCKTPTKAPQKIANPIPDITPKEPEPIPETPKVKPAVEVPKPKPSKTETKSREVETTKKQQLEKKTEQGSKKGRIRKISFWPGTKTK